MLSPILHLDQQWIEKLADGHAGTLRTLDVMAWLCRKDAGSPFVHSFIHSILTSDSTFQPGSVPQDPAETVFLWARDRIKFRDDPVNLERVADFQRTVECGYGDCDDKCVWLATGLLSLDIPVRFRVQSYTGQTWDHVFVEFWDSKRWAWVALDPTADGHSGILASAGWRQQIPLEGRELIYPI